MLPLYRSGLMPLMEAPMRAAWQQMQSWLKLNDGLTHYERDC